MIRIRIYFLNSAMGLTDGLNVECIRKREIGDDYNFDPSSRVDSDAIIC